MNTPTPTYYLSAWNNTDGQIQFSEVSYEQYIAEKRTIGDGVEWLFAGKVATVKVIAEAYILTRPSALAIANAFMHGQYIRYDFDLDRCDVHRVIPEDKTHPRL